ncbi:protocadherin gamma-A2-like isoform X20 [Clarias gariepinus]|uniref:protocadherin gamma-A2-like isoform X20 n=1 Tax=Clarias gariepinus TaxID=13013 RepID=UPI00234C06BE|nr:protocadherin gamma-A2-like isoform X20 [Clarias gariepinus]
MYLRIMSERTMAQRVSLFISVLSLTAVHGQVSYSVPEELPRGSLVGNIAHDLGLELKRLKLGKARIYNGENTEYIELNTERGLLLIKERIDREALCGQTTPCALHFQIILDNPMEFFSVTVEVNDINDNAPLFSQTEIKFEISEASLTGAKFVLERAVDNDVGINGLHSYTLKPTDNFVLKLHSVLGGSTNVEMVLENPLDREKQDHISLVLIAVDGGEKQMSGTMQIQITVLDANDNAPVCVQSVYKTSIRELAPKGTVLTTVSAVDADEGQNGMIRYYLSNSMGAANNIFAINHTDGLLKVIGDIDYEKIKSFEIDVVARDQGGHFDTCKVIVEVIDINDNRPLINIMSKSGEINENSKMGTVTAIINVQDVDSNENGRVQCRINENIPFVLKFTSNNVFSLVTESALDRESESEYTIIVMCADEGSPSLSSSVTMSLQVSDINDNAPVFEKSSYHVYITENNPPGLSIFTVKAGDSDSKQNARVSYMLEESSVNGMPVSSYMSVSPDSGVIYAERSFDYEQLKQMYFRVKAQDGGNPPLSSNVSVKLVVQDQNDNAPQILYPVQTGGSVVAEMVPRSAEVGYLVTKVVAVDVDSGQNAWLSYKLQKATDRALFEVGAQNGEIRTVRQVTDKDAVKQKLTVIVEDNGQPSRSATVNINVAVADTFPEMLSEFTDFTHDKELNDNLTFYLVLALAVVSFLFIVSIITILSVKCYRWRRERMFYKSGANLPVIPYFPPLYADVGGTGTLQHMYNYETYKTTDSRKSDLKFPTESIISLDNSETQTQRDRAQRENLSIEMSYDKQKPPNADWRFNQNQRPGPSGAAATPDVPMGTGPWPNPPTEAEQLQALMAAANEVSEATNTLGPGTMGLSTRYSPQFTLQHVPDYRQNVYIPGSTATLSANPQQPQQPPQALPAPQVTSAQVEPPKPQTPASKKKITKKEKK